MKRIFENVKNVLHVCLRCLIMKMFYYCWIWERFNFVVLHLWPPFKLLFYFVFFVAKTPCKCRSHITQCEVGSYMSSGGSNTIGISDDITRTPYTASGRSCATGGKVNYTNNLLPYDTIRYNTRCYFDVQSKADVGQLNLQHGTNNWKVEKQKN